MARIKEEEEVTGLNWGAMIATISLFLVAAGAFWTIVQTEFSGVQATDASNLSYVKEQDQRIRTIIDNLNAKVDRLNEMIHRDYVTQPEHRQFATGMDALIHLNQDHIKRLEDSRPTTGELKSTATALKEQVDRLSSDVNEIRKQLLEEERRERAAERKQ